MKKLLTFTILLISFTTYSQEYITDANFESKISGKDKFSDATSVIIVEFYADFNKHNALQGWEKLTGVKYYRCDIADSPSSKKKYRVRTTPTIMIFVDGVLETTFKASLDFLCPVELPELKEAIQNAKKSSQF